MPEVVDEPDDVPGPHLPGAAAAGESLSSRAWIRRLDTLSRRSASSPRARRLLMTAAVVLFLGVTVASFVTLPEGVELHWRYVAMLLLVTTPLAVLANAAEFRVMGAANGHVIGWGPAVRLTVLASAANLLPLPGGIAVRAEALRQRGSSVKHALAANAAAALVWLGAAIAVIGALYAVRESDGTRALFSVLGLGGLICLAVAAWVTRRVRRQEWRRLFARLVLVELATVGVGATRVFVGFKVIGFSATAAQAIALSASHVIAAAIGIFPAGLGIREVLAGTIGGLVDLNVSASVAATACDRVAAQCSLGIVALLLVNERRRARAAAE